MVFSPPKGDSSSLNATINVKGLKIDMNGQFTKRFSGLAKVVIRPGNHGGSVLFFPQGVMKTRKIVFNYRLNRTSSNISQNMF